MFFYPLLLLFEQTLAIQPSGSNGIRPYEPNATTTIPVPQCHKCSVALSQDLWDWGPKVYTHTVAIELVTIGANFTSTRTESTNSTFGCSDFDPTDQAEICHHPHSFVTGTAIRTYGTTLYWPTAYLIYDLIQRIDSHFPTTNSAGSYYCAPTAFDFTASGGNVVAVDDGPDYPRSWPYTTCILSLWSPPFANIPVLYLTSTSTIMAGSSTTSISSNQGQAPSPVPTASPAPMISTTTVPSSSVSSTLYSSSKASNPPFADPASSSPASSVQTVIDPASTGLASTVSTAPGVTAPMIVSSTISLASNPQTSLQPAASTLSAAVLTFHGSHITANSASQFLIGSGKTLSPGGPALTIDGTALSLAPSATAIVIGSSTSSLTWPPPHTPPPNAPSFILHDTTITPDAQSRYTISGETLIPGAPAINIDGTQVSLDAKASNIVIGSSSTSAAISSAAAGGITDTDNAPSRPPLLTMYGTTISPNSQGDYILSEGGQALTLAPGRPAITVNDTVLSLSRGPSGVSALVIGGSSTQILVAATATGNTGGGAAGVVGSLIWSGIGGGGDGGVGAGNGSAPRMTATVTGTKSGTEAETATGEGTKVTGAEVFTGGAAGGTIRWEGRGGWSYWTGHITFFGVVAWGACRT